MSTVEILAGSIEYCRWPLTAVDANGAAIDLTSDDVQLAFRAVRDTSELAWHDAEWDPDAATSTVRALIGAGDFVLAAGVYGTYATVATNPEVPIFGPDQLGYLWVRGA